ncbi:MAG: hypothetical protein CVT94_02415 [Bacteroidetes bacterium HGW-Bacteroidetes-11]|jgi:hypothetical protein|nr:MAG: hypothetical protein CVT94_02415 [Bacteroidetes bacterium HGW-Bacteroidetes-11]
MKSRPKSAVFKPAVPKRWLFFLAAAVWVYAAFRVFKLAVLYVPEGPFPLWIEIVLGLIGFAVFFNFVFLKVSQKYIQRIAAMEQKNPCLFAFFGWKSYLLIAVMASAGVLFARYEVIPVFMQGIFYIALSGSLFMSAMMFVNAGILYHEAKGNGED